MSIIAIPNTFTVGSTIFASQHNSNFSTIYSDYNGNVTDANLSASAAISYSKLSLNNSIKSTDLYTGTVITQTGQVSGTSLTLLGNIPSGAGVIPSINIGNLFGSWVSKTIGASLNASVFQAATDGMVTAFSINTAGSCYIQGFTDGNATSQQKRMENSLPSLNPQGVSISFPVRKNDYYQCVQGTSTSSGMFFIPIGN